jgi:hypothetical protein
LLRQQDVRVIAIKVVESMEAHQYLEHLPLEEEKHLSTALPIMLVQKVASVEMET